MTQDTVTTDSSSEPGDEIIKAVNKREAAKASKVAAKASKVAAKAASKKAKALVKAAPKKATAPKVVKPAKVPSPAYVFAIAALKKNPKADFAGVKAAGAKKKIVVMPVVYGRAKLSLGLSKKKKKPADGASGVVAGNGLAMPSVTRAVASSFVSASYGGAAAMLADFGVRLAKLEKLEAAIAQIGAALDDLE